MPSKKNCKKDNCNSPLFARGYCSYHYGTEYLAPRMAEKKPSRSHIKPYSDKRAKQVSKYPSKRKAFIQAQREENPRGEVFCIFCDKIIYGEPDLHHGLGRDDESLLDETAWFLAHNKCHVHEYHAKSCHDIKWWSNYLFRIKNIHPIVYEKDLQRQDKAMF